MTTLDILPKSMKGALLVIAACALFACGASVSDKEHVENAKNYMAEKQVREAVIELKNALQANPKNAEARYLLGEVSFQIGDLPAAEKEFQRALEMEWSAEAASLGKTRAMIAQKKYKEVLDGSNVTTGWSEAAQANLLALEAQAQAGQGDLLKAKNTVLSAEKLDPDAYDVLKTTLLLQLSEKQLKDAGLTIDKALGLFPNDPELMLLSANLAVFNKQNKEAIQILEQIIKSGPDKVMTLNTKLAQLGILKLAILEKDFERMRKSRDAFIASNINDLEVDYFLAVAAFEEKNYEQAEEYLQKILKVAAGHGPTQLLSGSVSFAKRDFEKAAYYLSKYVANFPENNKARKLLGRAYLALGQHEDAQAEFNAVLNENADDPELIALVGLSEISGGQVESGIADLEKALTMASDNSSLKLQLAKAYITDGQTDKAIKQLDEVLQAGGDRLQIKSLKVRAYINDRNTDMAMVVAQQMLAESPDNPDVLFLMGSIQLAAKDISAARKYFEQALEVSAGHIGSEMNLARIDEQQGDMDAAKKHYLSILDKRPENIAVMTSLARLAARQGDEAGQIKWLEAARKADEKEVVARVALVELYINQNNLAAAEEVVNELETAKASKVAVLAARSRLLLAKKSYNQAQTVIEDLIREAPELDVGYYMQGLNFLALGDGVSAKDSLSKAYSLNPANRKSALLLGQLYNASGQHEQALKLAEELIASLPGDQAGYIAKGDALMAAKSAQQALATYDQAWKIQQRSDLVVRRFRAQRELSGLDKAADILTGWLKVHPNDELVLTQLAEAYVFSDKPDVAIEQYEKLIEMRPDDVTNLNNLAYLYSSGDVSKALEVAQRAYQLAPESAGIQDTYGWALLKNNKVDDAVKVLRRAAEGLPDNPEVQYHYAKALFVSGEEQAARDILRSIVDKDQSFTGIDDARAILRQ